MASKKTVSIVGPTAVGKTALAIRLCEKFSFELLNADSVQVYKGLDIISGKDIDLTTKYYSDALSSISPYDFCIYRIDPAVIYLIDLVPVTYAFNAHDFVKCADVVVEYLFRQGMTPCFVGGTGLYLKSFLNGIDTATPPDHDLREELGEKDAISLLKKLAEIDSKKAESLNDSERHNRQHLIRYIEIASSKDSVPQNSTKKPSHDNLMIGLRCEREVLRRRIDERVSERIEQGAFEEAENIFKQFNTLSSQVKTANGYRQLFEYFQGAVSKEEAISRWKYAEYKHAKNQMTWFVKEGNVVWFDIQDNEYENKILKEIDRFLSI